MNCEQWEHVASSIMAMDRILTFAMVGIGNELREGVHGDGVGPWFVLEYRFPVVLPYGQENAAPLGEHLLPFYSDFLVGGDNLETQCQSDDIGVGGSEAVHLRCFFPTQ
jgi:hypothetical protein